MSNKFDLKLNEAEQKYKKVRNLFDKVKEYYSEYYSHRYSGLFGYLRKTSDGGRYMGDDDKKSSPFLKEY